MQKKESVTLKTSPSRLNAWENCQYQAENQEYRETSRQVLGKFCHDIFAMAIDKMEEDFQVPYQAIWPEYESKLKALGIEEIEAQSTAHKWWQKWYGHPKIKELLQNPDILLLLDGQKHERAYETKDGRVLILVPLNKANTNALHGYPDCVTLETHFINGETALVIWDWKTGFTKQSETQIKAYGLMMIDLFPQEKYKYKKIIGRYFYVETGEMGHFEFIEKDLEIFAKAIIKKQNKISKTPKEKLPQNINPFCGECQFVETCKAAQDIKITLPWKAMREPKNQEDFLELESLIALAASSQKLLESLHKKAKETMARFIEKNGDFYNVGQDTFTRKMIPEPASVVYDLATVDEILEETGIKQSKVKGFSMTKMTEEMTKLVKAKKLSPAKMEGYIEILKTGRKFLKQREVISKQQNPPSAKEEKPETVEKGVRTTTGSIVPSVPGFEEVYDKIITEFVNAFGWKIMREEIKKRLLVEKKLSEFTTGEKIAIKEAMIKKLKEKKEGAANV